MSYVMQGLKHLGSFALTGAPGEERKITYGAARNIHAHIVGLERDKLRLADNLRKMKKSVPEGGNSDLVREVGVLTAKNEFLRVDVSDLAEKLKLANARVESFRDQEHYMREHIAQLEAEKSRLKNVLDAYNLRDKQAPKDKTVDMYGNIEITCLNEEKSEQPAKCDLGKRVSQHQTRIESIEKMVARVEDRGPILASSAILIAGITIGLLLSSIAIWIAR
jgi:hypothetical protein